MHRQEHLSKLGMELLRFAGLALMQNMTRKISKEVLMNISLIKNEKEHAKAMNKLDVLMDAENPTEQILNDMKLLAMVIENYEEERWPIGGSDPVDIIKFVMEQRNLKAVDMKDYFNGKTSRFYEIINHKRNLSLSMIKNLHNDLNIPYECLIV